MTAMTLRFVLIILTLLFPGAGYPQNELACQGLRSRTAITRTRFPRRPFRVRRRGEPRRLLRSAERGPMQIAKQSVVTIDYTLTDPHGEVLDSSTADEPLTYIHGSGSIIPGLENALAGKA